MPELTDKDFVTVKDKTTGQEWENPIPKHWVGTDLAPNVEVVHKKS